MSIHADSTDGVRPAVVVRDVTKSYGRVRAVVGVSASVAPGEVLCLCGPNGAGKTTLVEIIQGSRRPDSGYVSILGHRAPYAAHDRQRMSVLFQDAGAPARCRVVELLELMQAVYTDHLTVSDALAAVDLSDSAQKQLRTLSGGQRRRAMIAACLIANPRVLIMDEPTSGLDPQNRELVWTAIKQMSANGTSAIVTTHYLDEAEDYCDRVLLLSRATVLADGPPPQIIRDRGIMWCCSVSASESGRVRDLAAFTAATASRIGGAQFHVFFDRDSAVDEYAAQARAVLGPRSNVIIRRGRLEDVLLLAGDESALASSTSER